MVLSSVGVFEMRLVSFLLLSLLALPSYAEFCTGIPYSEPTDNEVVVVGQAIDSERQRPKVLNAFKGKTVEVGGGLATLNASLVRDYEKIFESTYVKTGGKFQIGAFHFGKSREFTTKITKEKYQATFMLQFDVQLPNEKWDVDTSGGSPLSDYALSLVNDPCTFKQVFGDSFIFQTQRGARVYVAINVAFSSDSNYQEFKKGMDGGVEGSFNGWTKSFCALCSTKTFTIPAFKFSASFEQQKANISETIRKDGKIQIVAM